MTEFAIALCVATIGLMFAFDAVHSVRYDEEIPEAEIVERDVDNWDRILADTDLRRDDQRAVVINDVDVPGEVLRAWGGTSAMFSIERDEH